MGTFCQRCRNQTCTNAQWAGSTWAQRIGTQVERLLTHPDFADLSDPKFADIRALNFISLEPSIALSSDDPWQGPATPSVVPERRVLPSSGVDEAFALITGKSVAPAVVPPLPNVATPPLAPTRPQPARPATQPVNPPHPPHPVAPTAPVGTLDMNTEFSDEGVMVDGSLPPSQSSPPVKSTPTVDPWDPTGKVKVVPAGAKIRMGG